MTDAIWIAVVVAGGALLTTWLNSRQLSKAKQEDYARQDVVAARAEAASNRVREVAEQAATAAQLLLEHDEEQSLLARLNAAEVSGRLSQIHTLVNSNMTAAMESEMVAIKAQHAMMARFALIVGNTDEGDASVMLALERRISELGAQLKDRAAATKIGEEAAAGG